MYLFCSNMASPNLLISKSRSPYNGLQSPTWSSLTTYDSDLLLLFLITLLWPYCLPCYSSNTKQAPASWLLCLLECPSTMLWSECFCPSKFICWNLIPNVTVIQGGASVRWLYHEGGVLMDEISFLIKEAPESCLSLPPYEDTATRCYLWTRRPSPDTESASALILDFLASRIVRNQVLLLKSCPVYGILLWQPKWPTTQLPTWLTP